MSISIMTKDGLANIPTLSGGGHGILERISGLEHKVAQIENTNATTDTYGLAKISAATDVTRNDSGLVMGARENNPSLDGTIANRFGKLESRIQNVYSLSGGIRINSNSDLNNYKDIGNYYCSSTADVQSISNCPAYRAFTLKVDFGTGENYPRQIIMQYSGEMFLRHYDGYTNKWQPWMKLFWQSI